MFFLANLHIEAILNHSSARGKRELKSLLTRFYLLFVKSNMGPMVQVHPDTWEPMVFGVNNGDKEHTHIQEVLCGFNMPA